MTTKSGKSLYLQAITMIDLASDLIEIHTLPQTWADIVANQVELYWLRCYPLPKIIIVDRGNKFLAKVREMIINDYGIAARPIIYRNLQENSTFDKVQQILGKI